MLLALTIFALSFAPGAFWIWYFYRRDKLEHEPKKKVFKLFFFGLLSAIPVAIIETVLDFNAFFTLLFLAPILEEAAKFLTVRITIYRDTEFDEPMDGIMYAVAVALGFASLENLAYIANAYKAGTLIQTTVIRALLSVPGHALFSAMWGYALGMSKFFKNHSGKIVLNGVILAIVLHGVFNFFCLGIPFISLLIIVFVLIMWIIVDRKIKKLIKLSPFRVDNSNGSDVDDNI
ncbi:PrsW family intramembrane metalloprotease [bacterium]|nr:PrsW family intramembrane metalloprotease [bacterium]